MQASEHFEKLLRLKGNFGGLREVPKSYKKLWKVRRSFERVW